MAERGSIRNPLIITSINLMVLLLGMAILLHGFVKVLPYHLDPDEPIIRIRANALATEGRFEDFYSPLGVIALAGQQTMLRTITPSGQFAPQLYYLFGRYFSTLYGMILLAVTYQAGRRLHSQAAGFSAMIFLIAVRDTITFSKLLKTDMLAWTLAMVAILLAIRAMTRQKRSLLAAAFGIGLLATAAKYIMLPVLLIPGLVALIVLPRTVPMIGIRGTSTGMNGPSLSRKMCRRGRTYSRLGCMMRIRSCVFR